MQEQLEPRQSSMQEMKDAGIPPESIMDAALLHLDDDLLGHAHRLGAVNVNVNYLAEYLAKGLLP